ncbi:hypothetical protein CI109_106914 [Kwoniella shandongensis]|uniref:Uncharacterized protein n=1 Tax=Kwoniella shandongensis TaxID=1734106 RepID=A0AAJ8LN38_9TREE
MISSFHPVRLCLKATLVSALFVLGHVLLTSSAQASSTPASFAQTQAFTPLLPEALSSLSAHIFLTLLWLVFALLETAVVAVPGRSSSRSGSSSRGKSSSRDVGNINKMSFAEEGRVEGVDKVAIHSGYDGERQTEDEDEDDGTILCRTGVELVYGLVTMGYWIVYWPEVRVIIAFFSSLLAVEFAITSPNLKVSILLWLTSHHVSLCPPLPCPSRPTLRNPHPALIPLTYTIILTTITLLNLHLLLSILIYSTHYGPSAIFARSFWTGKTGWWLDLESAEPLDHTQTQTQAHTQSQCQC